MVQFLITFNGKRAAEQLLRIDFCNEMATKNSSFSMRDVIESLIVAQNAAFI